MVRQLVAYSACFNDLGGEFSERFGRKTIKTDMKRHGMTDTPGLPRPFAPCP